MFIVIMYKKKLSKRSMWKDMYCTVYLNLSLTYYGVFFSVHDDPAGVRVLVPPGDAEAPRLRQRLHLLPQDDQHDGGRVQL